MYRGEASLFIDGETVYSGEGTTQGDPLAVSIYGIAILPLIQKLQGLYRQSWFADDASAGGKITQLKDWWTRMQSLGPLFGYHPNLLRLGFLPRNTIWRLPRRSLRIVTYASHSRVRGTLTQPWGATLS